VYPVELNTTGVGEMYDPVSVQVLILLAVEGVGVVSFFKLQLPMNNASTGRRMYKEFLIINRF
jgi:hypothetical protein